MLQRYEIISYTIMNCKKNAIKPHSNARCGCWNGFCSKKTRITSQTRKTRKTSQTRKPIKADK